MDTTYNFEDDDKNIILLPDLVDALVGIGERIGMLPVAIYDSQKCVEILIEHYDMVYEDALEFFNYNISGAYFGEYSPIFIRFSA